MTEFLRDCDEWGIASKVVSTTSPTTQPLQNVLKYKHASHLRDTREISDM